MTFDRRRRPVVEPLPPDLARDVAAGKMEQACSACGRWEAAHRYCSWCGRSVSPVEWYRNGDLAKRHGQRPATAPANPPTEYRDVNRWPAEWGPYPYARPSRTPDSHEPDPVAVYTATGGTLGLL